MEKRIQIKNTASPDIPVGTMALIFSKHYYGALTKSLETFDIERYFSVLYFLKQNNTCCQQQLCDTLAIDKTAMVKVMNYLVKAGYIVRQVNKNDRREHIIKLTKKGDKKTDEIVLAFHALDKKMFAGISKTEKARFVELLGELDFNLKQLPYHDLFFDYKNHSKKINLKK
ncbi:MAG: winged helix-turn-helix transcriptional regulator [Bacteroidia bacterium]|nr:winged helix-turn-helix transcriptional regulator [Bacteroidia bacterium]